jgi:hypothetical protein
MRVDNDNFVRFVSRYMHVYMHICIYIHTYMYVCVCMYVYMYVDICMYACTYIYIYIYIYIHGHSVSMCICIYTYIHTHIHILECSMCIAVCRFAYVVGNMHSRMQVCICGWEYAYIRHLLLCF